MEQLLADLRHGPDLYEIKDINKENGSSSGSLCNFQCFTDSLEIRFPKSGICMSKTVFIKTCITT